MKAIAVDDEPIALDIISSHASKVPFLDLKAVFTDAIKALEYLQKEDIDLLFLDIKMPDISGIEFYNSLRNKPLLIFTTAYSGHAITSFEMDAIDYLLKPFSFARFIKACNKANELYNFRNTKADIPYTYIKSGYDQIKIRFDDILYVEAAGNYMTFVMADEKKILSRNTFTEVLSLLPTEKFVRVHRSYIVSIPKIETIERYQIVINQFEIPISESYRQEIQKIIEK